MIRIATKTQRFLIISVVASVLAGTLYLELTAAETFDGLRRHAIEFPCNVLRGFQRLSVDGFDSTYDESPWLLSPTLEAL